jgi:hypothetical protein
MTLARRSDRVKVNRLPNRGEDVRAANHSDAPVEGPVPGSSRLRSFGEIVGPPQSDQPPLAASQSHTGNAPGSFNAHSPPARGAA